MNITDEQREGAAKILDSIIKHLAAGLERVSTIGLRFGCDELEMLRVVRSALEPQTVTIGWAKKWWKYGHSEKFWKPYLAGKRHQTEKFFREMLKELGVNVKEDK